MRARDRVLTVAVAFVVSTPLAQQGSRAAAEAASAGAPVVVGQVPAASLAGEALGEGTLRAPLGEGGRLVLLAPGGGARVLTDGFASAADPEVSFDGRRILFAGRQQADDPWCVWEMRVDGSERRKITCGEAGARQPVYQSTVYTITPANVEPWIQLAFVGTNPGEMNEAGVGANTSLWSVKADGTALRRLSYNLSNDMDPVILPDGRMVYAGWLLSEAKGTPPSRVALLGLNEDGTDYQLYAGPQGLRVKQMPAPTADGQVVFVESDTVGADGAGRLAVVSQRRPLHSYRSLTGEADGLFRAPAPLPDGRLLVAWRPAASGTGAGAASTFGIYSFDPATGARRKLVQDPAWHSLQAKLVAARPVPDARSSVVRADDPEGRLYVVDVNIDDLGGRLAPGEAKRLRVVEGVAAASGPPARRLLGEVPIEDDGSVQVQLPANTPLKLQLVDRDGLALRSSAWVWIRNAAAQGCVGCHEDPERTPPNRFVKALAGPAPALNLAPERRRTVGYAADIAPIVERRCRTCHGGSGWPPLLEAGREREALAPYVTSGAARRSRVIWHLVGRNAARSYDAEAGSTPPAPMPMQAGGLSADELRAFIEWIDLGGQP